MKTLTGMGGLGNARELAETLRQMGRGRDTMLAHITPEEAQMLLEAGGSGRINPMTGLPEFQPEDDMYSPYGELNEPVDYSAVPEFDFARPVEPADIRGMEGDQFERFTGQQPMFTGAGSLAPQDFQAFDYGPQSFAQSFQPEFDIGFGPGQFQPTVPQPRGLELGAVRGMTPDQFQRFTADQQAQPSGIGERLQGLETGYREFRQQYPMLERLLSTGAASLPAILAARRARREGRAASEELRGMSAPIRAQAEALRQQALTGGLTPQQARQQEARRAQLRQSAAGRGATTGTQEAMIENTLARQRSELAEQNLNSALRQLNIANTIDEAAIRARLQSDRETDQLVANILGKLVRSSAGVASEQGSQPPTLTSPLPENRLFTPPESRV